MYSDTIAAISTATAEGGIGIIRISGTDAVSVADRVFLCAKKNGQRGSFLAGCPSHTIHYGHIVHGDRVIDEVLVNVLRAPRSYTAEDTVEINCHGGIVAMQEVLREVLHAGARAAQPGEFTRRAFLNGRIDLSSAEAVMDVITSKNQYALQNSVRQLNGGLYRKIESCRRQVLTWMAEIEAGLDDPEHISLEGFTERIRPDFGNLMKELDGLRRSYSNGRLLQNGISTVIVGKPNAGKSSLLNLLVGQERAIVTDIAGTTRDILQETVQLDGITLHMVDTAGIRAADDVIERMGVERAKEKVGTADLVLFVVDASRPLSQEDTEILHLLSDKRALVLLNKTDLAACTKEQDLEKWFLEEQVSFPVIPFSTKETAGLETLRETISALFFQGKIGYQEEILVTNLRQFTALEEAIDSLKQVAQAAEEGLPEDFLSIDLRAACEALGKITGDTVGEDLVEEIFSKFCMGK